MVLSSTPYTRACREHMLHCCRCSPSLKRGAGMRWSERSWRSGGGKVCHLGARDWSSQAGAQETRAQVWQRVGRFLGIVCVCALATLMPSPLRHCRRRRPTAPAASPMPPPLCKGFVSLHGTEERWPVGPLPPTHETARSALCVALLGTPRLLGCARAPLARCVPVSRDPAHAAPPRGPWPPVGKPGAVFRRFSQLGARGRARGGGLVSDRSFRSAALRLKPLWSGTLANSALICSSA